MLDRVANCGGSLLVPVALWGKEPPSHCITCLQILDDGKHIVTGSSDGQIVTWTMNERNKFESLNAGYMLFGHATCVAAVCPASESCTETQFVSCDRSGKVCLWDCVDGRCVESVITPYVHRNIRPHAYPVSGGGTANLMVCIGEYAEILLMCPKSLTIQHTLCSRVEPDWINALCIIKPPKRSHITIGVSNCGMIKIWSLTDLETRDRSRPIFEDESKQIGIRNAMVVEACPENPRCMLVVTHVNWHIYDASDFCSLACHEITAPEHWVGGKFVAVDKVAAWSSDGTTSLFQIPRSQLRGKAVREVFGENIASLPVMTEPFCYCVLNTRDVNIPLVQDASFCVIIGGTEKRVLRGDCTGTISVWNVPHMTDKSMAMLLQDTSFQRPEERCKLEVSLASCWARPSAVGIADELLTPSDIITATVHVASQGRLILGRNDGSIVLVSATQAIKHQLLEKTKDMASVRVLYGHEGTVTCLLYPHEEHIRYDANHLLSGGIDFSVYLWHLNSGTKVHKFCVQAGPIMKLLVPPQNCNRRILDCVCSVGSDHSVALLSVKETKCLLLASRHIYPVMDIKWRPLDDFLLVQCEDMSVYVWQMETGHLDRILTGLLAEEVLQACDEQLGVEEGEERAGANSAVQMLRAIKHKNVAVMKQIAQGNGTETDEDGQMVELAPPLHVQGLRTNCRDGDSHIAIFNVEALILGLLAEEHAVDLRTNQSSGASSTTEKTTDSLSGLLAMAKDKAESVLKTSPTPSRKNDQPAAKKQQVMFAAQGSLYIESAQLLLSLLHAWDMDKDLDRVCQGKLGLIPPKVPLCFGGVSRHGHVTLLLPCGVHSPGGMREYNVERKWTLSPSLTTQHLLTVIACANTLMSMVITGFMPQHEKKRRLVKRISQMKMTPGQSSGENEPGHQVEQAQVKQGWSLLAAMHCVLLPELVQESAGERSYKPPRIEMLARRWQERCFELREATQALLVRELTRIGPEARKQLVDLWSCHLPMFVDSSVSIFNPPSHDIDDETAVVETIAHDDLLAEDNPADQSVGPGSYVQQVRRNQATAIVVLAVVGAQFPNPPMAGFTPQDDSLARATSQALMELLVQPPSGLLPPFSPLRRAAIDLLGKGFVVWQPYLDISKVLLALLEIVASSDKLLPPGRILFPLNAQADACRTARQALTQIASVRPPAFITALSKEVARHNAQTQHATIQHNLSPLIKARAEILKIIEVLSDKQYSDLVDLIIPVGEVLVHCLDTSLLKQRNLQDIFPPIAKFSMVSYCPNTRRIAFGGKNGTVVIHELRATKSQIVQAHSKSVTACAFSEEGKHLATYSADEARINFWQTSQSFLGMGSSQVKLLKQVPAPPSFVVQTPGGTPHVFRAKIVWISAKALTLLLPNNKEHRFSI